MIGAAQSRIQIMLMFQCSDVLMRPHFTHRAAWARLPLCSPASTGHWSQVRAQLMQGTLLLWWRGDSECDGSTLATVWSGAHWAARLVLSTAVLCRVQPPPPSLSWGAAHILTLTQIIFQHCATPRTHTQQPPSRAATGTVGIRMEAWKWHGGQLTWLIWTNFGYNSSYSFPSQESEYYENIFFYLFLNLTFMICSTVSYWQQLYYGWRKVLSAIHCIHCIHSPTPSCLNLSVYKSCYREGIIVTGTTLFNTQK